MSWRIPESDIERVKRETDLRALVRSRGIELKKHGAKDWIGRCPFHKDQDTPNFITEPRATPRPARTFVSSVASDVRPISTD